MFQKPKGTVDILPEETVIWHKMEEIIRDCTKNAGFHEIRIPTFELSGVYKRGVGQTTDIVQKEMFTLSDRGDNTEMCLRRRARPALCAASSKTAFTMRLCR